MNMGIIIIIAVLGVWGLGVFFGVITGLTKPFKNNTAAIDSSSIKDQEQKTIDDTNEKQQKLMDDMKQKMEDQQH
jgi:hypothetical protein